MPGRAETPQRARDVSLRRIDAALPRRAALLEQHRTTACRLFHGASDGIAGLVIEKYDDVLIVQQHEQRCTLENSELRCVGEYVRQQTGARAVYRKFFPKDRDAARPALQVQHTDPQPWIGRPVPPELEVIENQIRFRVRPYDGYASGLFLEQRDNRRRVRQLASGVRLLNGFSYTC